LRDAELEPSAIDVVACAASGVNRVDLAEEEGLARVFGSDVATVATKGIWGESFGAAPALSMAAAVAWLSGVTPAPLLRGELNGEVRHVLVTALGYYGNVSVVILRKASEA
jgi:3-oxoacyl-(acyl-carrier-protein) synthase